MKRKSLWILAAILSAGLFAGATSAASAEELSGKEVRGNDGYEVVCRTRGDVNGDGKISLRDALRALRVAAGIDEVDEDTYQKADADYDGTVSSEDALLLLQAALTGCSHLGYDEPEDEHILIVDPEAFPVGDYCYQSLADAVAYLNDNPPASEEERKVVLFAPGVVREYTVLEAPYVTYRAMDTTQESKITFYYASGHSYYSAPGGIYDSIGSKHASVCIGSDAHDFHAEYMTFENSFNIYVTEEELEDEYVLSNKKAEVEAHRANPSSYQTQALALYSKADRQVFENCKFYGRQDTLCINNGRMLFKDCYIEGTVDYIYGSATAVFVDCQLNMPYGGGYLTAASTAGDQTYGFLFYNCEITKQGVASSGQSAPAVSSYALGRPWGERNNGDRAMVTYYYCKMDDHIKSGNDRFADMSIDREEARWFEIGTMDLSGKSKDLSAICPSYETILSEKDVTGEGVYAPWRWLYGTDKWNPAGFEVPSGQ